MTSHQASFSEFLSPESELDNLLLAVRNMLRQYRKSESRFELEPNDTELKRLCGHRSEFGGNFSQLEARLNSKLRDSPYEARAETGLSTDSLEGVLETDTASLPIVELHPDYYDLMKDEYHVQAGQFNERTAPMLIPVSVEEDMVIYWDPFYDYFNNTTSSSTEMTISDHLFLEYWSRTDRTRWTIWIDRGSQDTLSRIAEEVQ